MSVLPVGFGSATNGGGYQIERSLRFNSADSAYLNRTFGSGGNTQTWTWSAWIKRSSFANNPQRLFYTGNSNNNETDIYLSVDRLAFEYYVEPTNYYVVSSAVFRDPSAWYHFVVVSDTTNATSSDRMRIYVNGARITNLAISSYPAQNANLTINSAAAHYIGRRSDGTQSFDGYMTETNFIDGQALTPASFGETDSNTGVWKPKAYSGTYGTNGFYLKFADNSGTTSTTLGKDSSGNGNNWTPNNFSVTAGVGNDSLVDSPTAYGTDTGVGGTVRGNYCTLNPLDNGNSNILLTNGNLSVSSSTTWDRGVKATVGISSGKWYYEYTHGTVNAGTNPAADLGWTKYTGLVNSSSNGGGASSDTYLLQGSNGNKNNGGTSTSYGSSFTTGDTVMCALDLDNGKVYWGKNGTWFASGDPAAGTNAAYTGLSGTFFPLWYWGLGAGTSGVLISNINFGQRAFAYTAPSGFKALCTQNLPTPTIGATSTTQANDYFNAITYTGTGSSNAQTGVGFQPDFVWIKGRSGATDHGLYDAVRGVQKQLESNTNVTAETTETTGLTAFGSDGFTVGALAQLNTNAATYVAWNWNAGGSNQTISVGQYATSPANVPSIASTVRANTTAGFSIVTYTGNGSSGATIGHGLGAVPSFYIVKNRGSANKDWECYHISLGNTNRIRLNVTAAADTGGTMWANTTPTNNVFSVGSDADVNASTNTYVAYCFAPVAGYSAFGSYVGNGSTDGPFVYTGFRPRYLMVKEASGTSAASGNWVIHDAVRDTYNVCGLRLVADNSYAEGTVNAFDFLSNGFKLRTTDVGRNESGGTYIYAAFAESPFKYSLAR